MKPSSRYRFFLVFLVVLSSVLTDFEPNRWGYPEATRVLPSGILERFHLLPVRGLSLSLSLSRHPRAPPPCGRRYQWLRRAAHEPLAETCPETCLPPGRLRAAVAEAAAQSLPIHGLGSRPGATEAAAEFDVLLDRVLGDETT